MAKFKMIALTTPVPGKEAEYHDWYQNVHLPELTQIAGLHAGQRYKLVTKFIGEDTNQYLAIYDIECDDPMIFLGAMGEAAMERHRKAEASGQKIDRQTQSPPAE